MSKHSSICPIALAFVSAAAVMSVACEGGGGKTMTLESPHRTYVVELSGRLSAPILPVIDHHVRVTARRGTSQLVQGHEVHFADWLDEGFIGKYGPSEWLQENVLRFVSTRPYKGNHDAVRVENQSHRTVSFLKIICQDLILGLDLSPSSVTSFNVTAQRAALSERSWVDVDGEWAGGEQIRGEGRNFDIVRSSRAYEYVITISESGASIAQKALP